MSRYVFIAFAIIVGGLIGMWLSRRGKVSMTTLIEESRRSPLWPWILGLVVLMVGLLLLIPYDHRADKDAQYKPAQIKDGTITPGQFEGTRDDN
jgi:predicted lysophospholipase L1 biosynthesis ABC-type transport system permease subunit